MDRLRFDCSRQLLGAQCSGALILAKLNHLRGLPACTDLITKPWVEEAAVTVLNVAPVGEKELYVERAIRRIGNYLPATSEQTNCST